MNTRANYAFWRQLKSLSIRDAALLIFDTDPRAFDHPEYDGNIALEDLKDTEREILSSVMGGAIKQSPYSSHFSGNSALVFIDTDSFVAWCADSCMWIEEWSKGIPPEYAICNRIYRELIMTEKVDSSGSSAKNKIRTWLNKNYPGDALSGEARNRIETVMNPIKVGGAPSTPK